MMLNPVQRRALLWSSLALAAGLLLWLLGPVLTPFVVAAVLAYALHPAVETLASRRVPRVLAVMAVEFLAIAALLALMLLVVPILSKQLPLLKEQLPVLADRVNQGLSPWLGQFGFNVSLDGASLKAFVGKLVDANLEDWIGTALSSARIGGSALLAFIGNAVLMPVVLYYLLIDWPNLVRRVHDFIPPRLRDSASGFLEECDTVLGKYLRGQLLVMLAQSTGCTWRRPLFC